MVIDRTCNTCGTDISHRHGNARWCENCRPSSSISTNTCPVCGVTISRAATFCWKHWQKPTNTERDQKIVQRYLDGEKCADLAREYGIVRERIRQIIVKAGVDSPWNVKHNCKHCGTENVGKEFCNPTCYARYQQVNQCYICGAPTTGNWCSQHINCNPWRVNEVVTLYDTGIRQVDVAEQMGFAQSEVARLLNVAGRGPGKGHGHLTDAYYHRGGKPQNHCWVCGKEIQRYSNSCRTHVADPLLYNTIATMRMAGCKIREIGVEVGMTQWHVSLILRKCGIRKGA